MDVLAQIDRLADRLPGDPALDQLRAEVQALSDEVQLLRAATGCDPLTGVANRRMLSDALRREVARATRTGEPLSLVILELDRFESFAALNGAEAGDQLLRAAAEAWTSLVRASDLVARIGASAFAIILPGAPLQPAATLSERLRCVMPEDATASAGVAQAAAGESAESLLARAAEALRGAKAGGLDRVGVAA